MNCVKFYSDFEKCRVFNNEILVLSSINVNSFISLRLLVAVCYHLKDIQINNNNNNNICVCVCVYMYINNGRDVV